MPPDSSTPMFCVDFNELLAEDLVLLSVDDYKIDASGSPVQLYEGLEVSIFQEDVDNEGKPDNLVGRGIVERNRDEAGWAKHVKWCCRISREGIKQKSNIETK